MNEERKLKISESLKGHVVSEETKQKMAEAKKGRSRKFTMEHRMAISKAMAGKPRAKRPPMTDEQKQKIRESLTGFKHTNKTKEKLSAMRKGKTRAAMSEEQKAKLSESLKAYYQKAGDLA